MAAAKSRRIVAPWHKGSSEEESRGHLQARLTTMFKLLFWCFVALMAFLFAAYTKEPGTSPMYQRYVYVAFACGIATQAFIWRVLLLRRKLSFAELHLIDTIFAIGANVIIAFCATVSFDQRQASYTCVIYSCWTVLTRALIVPSTGKRTAIVSAIAMLPMAIGITILMKINTWPDLGDLPPRKDVPSFAALVGYFQIAGVTVLLSASGSRIIYGLQQKVTAVRQLGQYRLGRLLGEGGNDKVYLAHHFLLRRPTAIKLVPAAKVGVGSLARFEREVQYMSQLTHPNTVAVYDYGHSDGAFYYAMEYLGDGIDLQVLVTRHGKQPAERVRQILIQACSALQEAHDRKIIHRDIKPANIILCERGAMPDFVKVVDYGLVKEIATDSGMSTQIVLGTPSYMAPEAMTDASNVGPGLDLYAIGAVGFFLLTAERVFVGATDLDTCIQHVTRTPDRPSQRGVDVPRALEDLIMQCLAKPPDERPASAQVLADTLRDLGPLGDWDDDRAAAWWEAHRRTAIPLEITELPTTTISIDLAARDEAA